MAEKKNVNTNSVPTKKEKNERAPPQQSVNITGTSPGQSSEANLSNDKFGGTRRRVPHQKTFITGTDDDGQAV